MSCSVCSLTSDERPLFHEPRGGLSRQAPLCPVMYVVRPSLRDHCFMNQGVVSVDRFHMSCSVCSLTSDERPPVHC